MRTPPSGAVPTPSRRTIRVVAVAVLLAGSAVLANAMLAAGTVEPPATGTATPAGDGGDTTTATGDGPAANGTSPTGTAGATPGAAIGLEETINGSNVSTAPIPPGAELTVVATQGFFVSDENAELVAFTRSGEVVYHEDRYRVYFDVDPVAGTRHTVEYVAAEQLRGGDCSSFDDVRCTDNVVERVNLSTGARERVWVDRTAGIHSTRHHDVDRLNETHLLVADIHEDRVFVVDVRDGEREWTWDAADHYSRDQGGNEGDWTHINDVEVLDDGRVMVSVRNMDEVVFVEPGEGVDESWTLGTDGNHSVLYEQHNPDYIPEERGGPAVVVGDSENNRVIEYRRVDPETRKPTAGDDGEWEATWLWRDLRMQWPRDADRLPNDRTLVVDSHGDRVLEVTPDGEVVWSVEIGMPYDAERLGTGDESAGGYALPRAEDGETGGDDDTAGDAAVDPANGSPSTVPSHTRVLLFFKDLLPSLVVNSLLYVAPEGIRFGELVIAFGVLVDLGVWGGLEYRWSDHSVRAGLGRVRDRVRGVFR